MNKHLNQLKLQYLNQLQVQLWILTTYTPSNNNGIYLVTNDPPYYDTLVLLEDSLGALKTYGRNETGWTLGQLIFDASAAESIRFEIMHYGWDIATGAVPEIPECNHDYFVPLSCLCFYLCPSCVQYS